MRRLPPISTPFPYTTLFRSHLGDRGPARQAVHLVVLAVPAVERGAVAVDAALPGAHRHHERAVHRADHLGRAEALGAAVLVDVRSEEHTSELQSRENLVCRL